MSDTAKRVANAYGCRDSACMFGGGAAGMSTNGGCSCLDGLDYLLARKVRLAVRALLRETERLEAAAPRWVPVTERLPEETERVLTISDTGFIATASRNFVGGNFYRPLDNCYPLGGMGTITHWMPFPAPPPGEEER